MAGTVAVSRVSGLLVYNNGLLLVTPVGGALTFLPTWSAGAFAFR